MRLEEIRIGELAARTGVSTRLLRYYEAQGLLHADRDGNGYRMYGESAVERVRLIRELLESGFTTELIPFSLPAWKRARARAQASHCPVPFRRTSRSCAAKRRTSRAGWKPSVGPMTRYAAT